MGEQAGVLRLELLAVLQRQMERGSGVEREGGGKAGRQSVIEAKDKSKGASSGSQVRGWGETGREAQAVACRTVILPLATGGQQRPCAMGTVSVA